MEKINKWMTKKNMAVFAIIGTIGTSILMQRSIGYSLHRFCIDWNIEWGDACMNTINYFGLFLFLGATALVPSLILFFLKDSIFELWKKTLFIYLFIYLFILIVVPWHDHDQLIHIFEKGIIALTASVMYVIFSIIYIFYKNHQVKSKN